MAVNYALAPSSEKLSSFNVSHKILKLINLAQNRSGVSTINKLETQFGARFFGK